MRQGLLQTGVALVSPFGRRDERSRSANGTGYGRQLSRQFSVHLKTFGIEKGVAFHAFRHTLSTALAEAGVDTGLIAKITGHASTQQVPTLETHYIHIAETKTLPERVQALGQFKPKLVLQKYNQKQFIEALLDKEKLHA